MKAKDIALLVGFVAVICHLAIIAEDINQVLNDPNEQNKPREVLKLAFDVSRYLK